VRPLASGLGGLCLALLALGFTSPALAARSSDSHAANWSTSNGAVECGIADIRGTALDPGTGAPTTGLWPGLQCAAAGIPRAPGGVGDPFVQLGQGRAGQAKIVDLSQDDLLVNGSPVSLAPGTMWSRNHITCRIYTSRIECRNSSGHGFKLASHGQVHLF
jgi:hypothetical protein